jgi:MFS family permease
LARGLDTLNFLLADIRDGLGPCLSIYLLLVHHWDQASIGFVMAVGGIGAIAAQAPAGALVDRTTAKRAVIIAGALTVTAGSLAMPLFPGLYSISGVAGAHRNRGLDLRPGPGRPHAGPRRPAVFLAANRPQ